jgi:hypothetical protein
MKHTSYHCLYLSLSTLVDMYGNLCFVYMCVKVWMRECWVLKSRPALLNKLNFGIFTSHLIFKNTTFIPSWQCVDICCSGCVAFLCISPVKNILCALPLALSHNWVACKHRNIRSTHTCTVSLLVYKEKWITVANQCVWRRTSHQLFFA